MRGAGVHLGKNWFRAGKSPGRAQDFSISHAGGPCGSMNGAYVNIGGLNGNGRRGVPPLTMTVPSCETATAVTAEECPLSVRIFSPVDRRKTRRRLSSPPVTSWSVGRWMVLQRMASLCASSVIAQPKPEPDEASSSRHNLCARARGSAQPATYPQQSLEI